MKVRNIIALVAVLSIPSIALASEDGAAVFKKSNCGSCHAAEKKSVGPSLKAIAEKYKDDKGAQAKLEAKVRSGGKDSFGVMPMPATAKSVSDADIKTMVAWILTQK
ncbi:MAG: c-type cytochrome [Gallionella sp.]|nr:c-type cytochrome [Gallionella sp.]